MAAEHRSASQSRILSLLASGDHQAAETVLAELDGEADAQTQFLRGLLWLVRDQPQSAKQALALAAAGLPDSPAVQANLALCLYRCGEFDAALAASARAIALAPRHADNHFNRGLIELALNRPDAAIAAFARACDLAPESRQAWLRLGETQHARGNYLGAEVAYRRALDLAPDDADLHVRLSSLTYDSGVADTALAEAQAAIAIDPSLALAWTRKSAALRRLGRLAEAMEAVKTALQLEPEQADALKARALIHQMQNRLVPAAEDFLVATRMRFAPGGSGVPALRELRRGSRAKLGHDIDQLQWLSQNNLLHDDALLAAHVEALTMMPSDVPEATSIDLPAAVLDRLDGGFNRLHHWSQPDVLAGGALNPSLDVAQIEADYRANPGAEIGWIDSLLRPEALALLHRYCLANTFWFDAEHVNGYLGAFFEDGFTAPLLLQIAGELRARFPRIFRDDPLTQLWAFKYDSRLDGIELHADIAAVNLNFWITPDAANTDPESGGLVVWDKAAPPEWGFDEFNTSTVAGQTRITQFLQRSGAHAVRVPYRQNRAVLFNSDLFHRTDTIRFREGYEHRRINITMLFGKREGRTN
ncbi:MAG: tetratricopeptide repeat protein [Lysobacteraceae bacterium]